MNFILDIFCYSQHTIDKYIPLIFRSHLEKPEKYSIPNQGQSTKEVSEVDALKPKITEQLTYHDYPNERVVVLQGENLWFSYKVCLDEKGPNEGEFKTHPENNAQRIIKFRADLDKSSDLSTSKQVKLALYTHFASPIRQTLSIKTVCVLVFVTQLSCHVFIFCMLWRVYN